MPRVLVTGATGFIGGALCRRLAGDGYPVRAAIRHAALPGDDCGIEFATVPDVGPDTEWERALEGVVVIVHLAARVHVMKETAGDPLAQFRRVNTVGTERLARAAASAGVRRLIYLSTIKVNGEGTSTRPFTEADPPAPRDPYSQSKWEAERTLDIIAAETGLEAIILRPPLVYGPGVKGNFLRLLELVNRGTPLPLRSVHNRRSLVFVGNLVDAIIACATHAEAAGRTFLVSDGEDVSTAELISRIAQALGRPSPLWPFPPWLMRLAGSVTGKSEEVARLFDSLQVDSSRIRHALGWVPPFAMAEGLAQTARWFLARHHIRHRRHGIEKGRAA